MTMDTTAKIGLTTLYEKTSTRGNRYFVGRLGAARIMLFEDKFADGDDPAWHLCIQEGPAAKSDQDRARQASDDSPAPQDAQLDLETSTRPRRRRRAPRATATAIHAPLDADPDDPLPDHLLE
jgi:hypothetical protein